MFTAHFYYHLILGGGWTEVDMEAARLVTAVTSVKPLDTCKDIFSCGWKHTHKETFSSVSAGVTADTKKGPKHQTQRQARR